MSPHNSEIGIKSAQEARPWFSARSLLVLLIVAIVSAALIGLIEGALAAWLGNPISFDDILFLGFVFIIGLALGYLVNRALRKRAINWVWLLGLVWMIWGVSDIVRGYDPKWHLGCSVSQTVVNAFFIGGHKCGGGEDALYGLFFTMPALMCAGCSVGAWMALRVVQQD